MSIATYRWVTPKVLLALTLAAVLLAPRECLAQAGAALEEIDGSASVAMGHSGEAPDAARRISGMVSVAAVPAASEQTGQAQSEAVSDFCLRPRRSSSCRFFAVTDFGVLVGLTQNGWSLRYRDDVGKGQLVTDLGVMWNVASRQALGATFLFRLTFSGAEGEALAGPALRYRFWLKDEQSLDQAVGTAIAPLGDNYGDLRRGSVLGLVKYSPAPWIGFAIRSEVLRRTDCVVPTGGYCGHFGYDPPGFIQPGKELRPARTSRILAGIELSDKPGLVLNGVWWGAVGLVFLLLAAGGSS